jgi:hypothetical protein
MYSEWKFGELNLRWLLFGGTQFELLPRHQYTEKGFPWLIYFLHVNTGYISNALQTLDASCIWLVDCVWNVLAHGDAREKKWKGNKGMEWVTSKRHMTAEHRHTREVKTLQADVHCSPANSRLNSTPPPPYTCRFKWTRPFRGKTKSSFCACAITFQMQSTSNYAIKSSSHKPSHTLTFDYI